MNSQKASNISVLHTISIIVRHCGFISIAPFKYDEGATPAADIGVIV